MVFRGIDDELREIIRKHLLPRSRTSADRACLRSPGGEDRTASTISIAAEDRNTMMETGFSTPPEKAARTARASMKAGVNPSITPSIVIILRLFSDIGPNPATTDFTGAIGAEPGVYL